MAYERIEERWINRDQKHLFRRIRWDLLFVNLALVMAFVYMLCAYVDDIQKGSAVRWAIINSIVSGR